MDTTEENKASTMGRRTGASLWRAVDTLVTNRELRSEHEQSEWDMVEEWLKNQMADRKNKQESEHQEKPGEEGNEQAEESKPENPERFGRKAKKARRGGGKGLKHGKRDTHKSVLGPSLPKLPRKNQPRQPPQRKERQRPPPPPPPLPYPLPPSSPKQEDAPRCPPLLLQQQQSSSKCSVGEQFMDRAYMQQMQHRLLEQHEETLRRRIRQRQAEEAQRERQLMLAGLVPSSTVQVTVTPRLPKRASNVHSRASASSSRSTSRRTPRTRPSRARTNASPRRSHRSVSQDKTKPAEPEEADDADLDEAAEPSPPPPVPQRSPEARPRLSILLQACRAVVGAALTGHEAPAARPTAALVEEEGNTIPLHRLKYESPLIAQLREVESVEELYRLAELIVANTKL